MTQGFYEQLGVPVDAAPAEIRAAWARVAANLVRRQKAIADQGGDPSPIELARSQADEAYRVLADPARRRRYDAMRAIAAEGLPTGSNAETELWRRASGALVHPAAGVAAELLRVASTLKVGVLSPVPTLSPNGFRTTSPDDERTVTSTATNRRERTDGRGLRETPSTAGTVPGVRLSAAPAKPADKALPPRRPVATVEADLPEIGLDDEDENSDDRVVPLRTGAVAAVRPSEPGLRVVDARAGAPVVVMPTPAQRAAVPPAKKPLSAEDVARLVDRHGHSGALLKAIREARGMSVQALSESTRISAKYLEAIEADAQDALPSSTFVRGYVREMARQLGLDEEATVAGYMRRLRG